MAFGYYILDENGNPVFTRDVIEWAKWSFGEEGDQHRRVGRDKIGDAEISTVFLGIDHNWSGRGGPVLWETMIFEDKNFEDYQTRCSGNKEQAEAMHEKAVAMVEAFYKLSKNDKKS
jgi:hypothetical protein